MNVGVRELALGNHHVLIRGDDNAVYAAGNNTL